MIMINLYDSFKDFNTNFLVFGLLWVAVGILGKIIGAGAGGLIANSNLRFFSYRIGYDGKSRSLNSLRF